MTPSNIKAAKALVDQEYYGTAYAAANNSISITQLKKLKAALKTDPSLQQAYEKASQSHTMALRNDLGAFITETIKSLLLSSQKADMTDPKVMEQVRLNAQFAFGMIQELNHDIQEELTIAQAKEQQRDLSELDRQREDEEAWDEAQQSSILNAQFTFGMIQE